MIEKSLKEQLQTVFEKLDQAVTLFLYKSAHPDYEDLKSLITDVVSTSSFLILKEIEDLDQESLKEKKILAEKAPYFEIQGQRGQRVSFAGIPTGHEFSSLILAILNSDMKGKLPDKRIIQRVQSLKGPIFLKTYISLTCENCPDVVQALNLMSILHPSFSHCMADGQYFQEELADLGILGVPTVISGSGLTHAGLAHHGGSSLNSSGLELTSSEPELTSSEPEFISSKPELIHSGRASFSELLEKLEAYFGQKSFPGNSEEDLVPQNRGHVDVLVVGSGPAGVSSAIYTARKGLKTVILGEKVGGQMRETKGIENFISRPYTEGPELSQGLLEHLSHYPVEIWDDQKAVRIISEEKNLKKVLLSSGDSVLASAVIIATGAKWKELQVPGEQEYRGRGVAYCPHCDGPFYKDKTVAVVGGGNSGVEAALDLSGIVEKVFLLEYGPTLKADAVLVEKLKSKPHIHVITSAQTQEIQGNGQKVQALVYKDRETQALQTLSVEGIFIQIGLLPNSDFVKDLVKTNAYGEIEIDTKGRTSQSGIYAAGDVTTVPFKQIIIAMGEGAKAGLAVFEDLTLSS
jgi:NADH-dependent peroxiredoxin subunit F